MFGLALDQVHCRNVGQARTYSCGIGTVLISYLQRFPFLVFVHDCVLINTLKIFFICGEEEGYLIRNFSGEGQEIEVQ